MASSEECQGVFLEFSEVIEGLLIVAIREALCASCKRLILRFPISGHLGICLPDGPLDRIEAISSPDWLTTWASRLHGSPQIPLTGSPREPVDYTEVLRSPWLAHHVSQSTTKRPSDHPDWLTTWASRLPKDLRIPLTGSPREPVDYTEVLRSPDWLTTW